MGERIRREDLDGRCTLTLDRPEKLNALDGPTFAELDAHCAALERETEAIGCVVLRGAGRAFCAGADLAMLATGGSDPRFHARTVERFARLPQPTVAAIHAVCFTGGLELALACDLLVAAPGARFADTHGRWGFVGGWGLSQRLPRRIGMAAAKRMTFTAREIDAAEALAIGLVDIVAGDEGLDGAVDALVAPILANSWHTNSATKRLLRETDGLPLDLGLAHEHYRNPGFSDDHRERIANFTKK